MQKGIIDRLQQYHEEVSYKMHMPGHKQRNTLMHEIFHEVSHIDVTEVRGTDNLYYPKEMLLEAKNEIREIFGAEDSFLLVNGSSSGIQAAIMTVCNPGDYLLVARNSHKSVTHGLIFGGVNPVYISPRALEDTWIGGIHLEDLRDHIERFPSCKGLIMTSPTYDGFCSDVEAISSYLHSVDKVLIVDEAHGAHFGLHEKLPRSAIQLGADIVIQSSHKTLPVLTQCSVLHAKGNRIDYNRLKNLLAMVQTSSPSYILMASIQEGYRSVREMNSSFWIKWIENAQAFIDNAKKLKHIQVLNKGAWEDSGIVERDYGKIIIDLREATLSGTELDFILRDEYGIQIEMSMQHYGVGIYSISDTNDDLCKLYEALRAIDERQEKKHYSNTLTLGVYSKVEMTPREAFYSTKEIRNIVDCVDCISGEMITPYPPGIPLLIPGELISSNIIEALVDMIESGIEVQGKHIEDNCVEVIKQR